VKFGIYKNVNGESVASLDIPLFKPIVLVIAALAIILGLGIGFNAGCKAYNRYQAQQDAKNQVSIASINSQRQHNLIRLIRQQADRKVAEARGIHKAQEIINATLTPLYVQHEAIQAQVRMAGSPNHTTIYVPSGDNGIPLINDVGPGAPASK
jgi:hypothetical protein